MQSLTPRLSTWSKPADSTPMLRRRRHVTGAATDRSAAPRRRPAGPLHPRETAVGHGEVVLQQAQRVVAPVLLLTARLVRLQRRQAGERLRAVDAQRRLAAHPRVVRLRHLQPTR